MDRKYWYRDVDFANLVPNTLEQLYKWNSDERTYETAKMIALSEDTKKYDSVISKASWKICLKGDTAKKHLSEKGSAKYLLDLIKNIEDEGVTRSEYGAVKREAAKDIIEQYGDDVLSSLKKDLEDEMNKNPRTDPNGSVSNSYHKLSSQISYIERILREKGNKEGR